MELVMGTCMQCRFIFAEIVMYWKYGSDFVKNAIAISSTCGGHGTGYGDMHVMSFHFAEIVMYWT